MNELALFYVCEPRSVKSTSPSIALWIDIPRQQTVPSQLVDTPGISSERLRLVVGEDHVQDFLHFHVVVLDVKARACEPTMWCPVEYLLVDIVVLVTRIYSPTQAIPYTLLRSAGRRRPCVALRYRLSWSTASSQTEGLPSSPYLLHCTIKNFVAVVAAPR